MWRSCTAGSLSIKLLPPYGRSCWTKGDTCARSEPCTAFWPNVWKLENAAASAAIPNTPSRNFWPPARTNAAWDITKLKGPVKWSYYYLYVILDIFSRYVVGWMVATQESSRLAKVLIAQSCCKQEIVAGGLTLHADRGSSMSSKALALLLADLGVTKSHSRPHVCDDNPYSESQFKTLKYRPDSRLVSARFSKPETSVGISSIGITATIAIRVSACTLPRTCTTSPPSPPVAIDPKHWRPPMHSSRREKRNSQKDPENQEFP